MSEDNRTRILFVCTGNVFRSMTAEYALRRHLGDRSTFLVASAGTRDDPTLTVRKDVADYLLGKGLDVSMHRRRLVTADLLGAAQHVIAMSTDHQKVLRDRFALEAPLYLEACGGNAEALPDVDDLFAPHEWHGAEARAHVKTIIDTIADAAPLLAERLLDR